jgi:hypothetical protein
MNGKKRLIFICFILGIISMLYSCEPNTINKMNRSQNTDQSKLSVQSLFMSERNFISVVGWVNDKKIIYGSKDKNNYILWTYQIFNGEKKKLYETKDPIVNTIISPSGTKILIHTAPTVENAVVTILSLSGEVLANRTVPSHEFSALWNPFDENKMLFTAFDEEWNFRVYMENIEKQELVKIDTKQPFMKWAGIGKLNWIKKTPENQSEGNLYQYYLKTNQNVQIDSKVVEYENLNDKEIMIKKDMESNDHLIYQVHSKQNEQGVQWKVPFLTSMDAPVIMNSASLAKENQYLLFVPLTSGPEDSYNEGYNLVMYDLISGEKQTILKHVENEPISCSVKGNYCLYGYRFEKLIHLDTGKITTLVQFKEGVL